MYRILGLTNLSRPFSHNVYALNFDQCNVNNKLNKVQIVIVISTNVHAYLLSIKFAFLH